jgi:cytosine/adenosine deaminase-related metal-dependent hydrolase
VSDRIDVVPTVVLSEDEPTRVRAVFEGLGLPGLIDIHTHFMPQPVLTKVWDYFDRGGERLGEPWPIAYRLPEPQRVQRLRDFGVLRFTSLVYPHKPGMAAWLNTWARGFARATPDCLQSATFYPEPSAAHYVAEALADGAVVFKAHVQVGDYDPTDPLLDPVWDMLQEARVPVVLHAGSGPQPGTHTGPANVAAVLRRFPGMRLVIAHLGMPEYAAFLDLAQRHNGVHLDTTMAFTDFAERRAPFPADLRPRLVDLGERVLLGTDFPNIPHPYLHALESLERLDLGADWLRGVLHDNAARLLAG